MTTPALSSVLEIVYFTSKTCSPCKQLLPRVEKLCSELAVKLLIRDIDQHPQAAAAAGVMSVPAIKVGDLLLSGQQARLPAIRKAIDELCNPR